MAKPKINIKIMAITGTEDATWLVNNLAHFTDDIYAIMSDDYGNAPVPGGNITVIRRTLDEKKLDEWIDDVGISLIIDGCAPAAEDQSRFIREHAEKKGVDYINVVKNVNITDRTVICRSPEELIHSSGYADHILVKAGEKVFEDLMDMEKYQDKVIPLLPAEGSLMEDLAEKGYRRENMVAVGRRLSVPAIVALIDEYDISRIIIEGTDFVNLFNYIDSADISKIGVSINGEVNRAAGLNAGQAWKQLADRFGIPEDF